MIKIICLLLLLPFFCTASIKVAFLEVKDASGKIRQLEPNGKYAHIAISYKEKWLHAHPFRGVEIVSQQELEKIGTIKKIIVAQPHQSISDKVVRQYLGKAYDHEYSWSDEKIYCSELVAKILNIKPLPMTMDSSLWPAHFQKMRGELGISPDEIFSLLN